MRSVGEQLMPLLLEEMPIDDFERVLNDVGRQVSAEGAHADDVRQIELARELRKVFDRYKRRGSELAALYETAGDLSSLREPETVLQSIVRRGRQLAAVLAFGATPQAVIAGAALGAVFGPPVAAWVASKLPADFHPYIGNVVSMTVCTVIIIPILSTLPGFPALGSG